MSCWYADQIYPTWSLTTSWPAYAVRDFLDLFRVHFDPLFVSVIVQVSFTFQGIVAHITRPPTGPFLDLEPRVHVVFEEPSASGQEMPHFVYADDCVSLLNSLEEFWCAPGPYKLAFRICVSTDRSTLQKGFGHFLGHAGGTERKGEFAGMTVG